MENHGENRAPNICMSSRIFITRYKIYRIPCDARKLTLAWEKVKFWHR